VQKFSGDAAVALRPADHLAGPLASTRAKTRRPNAAHVISSSQHRETKTQARHSAVIVESLISITARRKSTNGVRWKNLLRRYRIRRLPEIRFLELAKGFEPLTL
jgi:hypothetical protein